MKKLFYSHPNVIITTLVLIFLGILAALYFWVVNVIVLQTHRALMPSPQESAGGFDLAAASKLDLRGLVGATVSMPTQAPAPTVAPTTTPASAPTTTTSNAPGNPSNSTNTESVAQQLSGLAQAIPDNNPDVTPVIFSNLQFTSIAKPITVDISAADKSTADALNNLLEQSSHFTNVAVSSESVATSGRILYSMTFVYVP